jgi:GAF domain-containing protein
VVLPVAVMWGVVLVVVTCGADLARMERYEADGTVTDVAGWSKVDDQLEKWVVGSPFSVSIAAQVQQTGRPARVDSFADASGPIAEEARTLGIRSSVGCPIVVRGRIWGVINASSKVHGSRDSSASPTESRHSAGRSRW